MQRENLGIPCKPRPWSTKPLSAPGGCRRRALEDRAHFSRHLGPDDAAHPVDAARARGSGKRGGGVVRLDINESIDALPNRTAGLVDLDEALEAWRQFDARRLKWWNCLFRRLSVETPPKWLKISPQASCAIGTRARVAHEGTVVVGTTAWSGAMSARMRSCVGQGCILRAGLLPAQPAGYQSAAGYQPAPQTCNNTGVHHGFLKSLFARCPTSLNRASFFYDITTLLKDPARPAPVIDGLKEHYRQTPVDLVLGIEARGSFLRRRWPIALGAALCRCASPGNCPPRWSRHL